MTEFNAQEIIDCLNQKLFNIIFVKFANQTHMEPAAWQRDIKNAICNCTENVRKVERYANLSPLNICLNCKSFKKNNVRLEGECLIHKRYFYKEDSCPSHKPRYTLEPKLKATLSEAVQSDCPDSVGLKEYQFKGADCRPFVNCKECWANVEKKLQKVNDGNS